MSEEPTTPEPVAEPSIEATPPTQEANPEPKPEVQPEKPPEPDYRAAYVGLQRTINKLHARDEDRQRQLETVLGAVQSIKSGQSVILKQTVGEDAAKDIEARELASRTQIAARQAAAAAEQFVTVQTGLYLDLLREAGVNPQDPNIDWAQDSANVQEWSERAGPSIKVAIRKANEERIRQAEAGFKARSAHEIRAEAEALTQRQLKEAEVDKVDTAKGGPPSSLAKRLMEVDPSSKEFRALYDAVMSGRDLK